MPYKVVEEMTRWGTNWAVFKQYILDKGTHEEYLKGLKFRREHPEYFPKYLKDSIVKAAPQSLGIMCFSKKKHAEAFIRRLQCEDLIIIRVKGLGQKRSIFDYEVITGCGVRPWWLETKKGIWSYTVEAPLGTISYPAVKVLE